MKIHFLSAECYPAAKTGGLADVVGALPKYLNALGCEVSVFMPKYHMPWFFEQQYVSEYIGNFNLGNEYVSFHVERIDKEKLGFYLYVIDIPGKFDRNGVYADASTGIFFGDEVERNIAFQRAYLDFVNTWTDLPDVIHNHDHHTGLVPFLAGNCPQYQRLKNIPTVFTIHNQAYQGSFDWNRQNLLPRYDSWKSGMMDWQGRINPLASSVKCSWKLTTVSPSYMEELKVKSFGLEWLFNSEAFKSVGILNGIDTVVWNPKTDSYLDHHLKKDIHAFKLHHKKSLLEGTGLDFTQPLMTFIGRFAAEKGADLLPQIMEQSILNGQHINFIILGTGDKGVEYQIKALAARYPNRVIAHIMYNEALSRKIYSGSDFLIMPSRVEPCGLNQMYALRYGTIPVVHNIGGLKDSVFEFDGKTGCGFKFKNLELGEILYATHKAKEAYYSPATFKTLVKNALNMDYSWEKSAKSYYEVYKQVIKDE